MDQQLRFTIFEMLSLIGVFQCVYILVYILFRVRNFSHVILPLLYFLVLGISFLLDFGRSYIGTITPYYDILSWAFWFMGPPLSVLLIIQMAQITKLPSLIEWSVLFFVPAAYIFARVMVLSFSPDQCAVQLNCHEMIEWFHVAGLVAGAASLLMIWGHRNLFSEIRNQRAGQERYWLVLALVFVNIFFLASMILRLGISEIHESLDLVRTILGLSFVYLVTTSLFRIYPQAFLSSGIKKSDFLSQEDLQLAQKIEKLLALDKIYHEATYSRSTLAQELGTSEATMSRVINVHFGKSFPQLLNEHRIEDAKRLLLQTDASMKIVAQDVGFNSLPSFNRVFKDLAGQSPSDYRKNMIG